MRGLYPVYAAIFLASACHAASLPDYSRGLPALNASSQGRSNEHSTEGKDAVVSTEVDVCSNIGADLILEGGSAADAIIGASLCVGSIDAFHSGIGGGGFMLLRYKHGSGHKVDVVDMREEAPAASNETMYSANPNKNASTIGGLSVGIPGELRGWEYLHSKHGKLPWKKVVAPAVKLNREGFKVTSQLSVAIAQYSTTLMCSDRYFKEVYCPNGTAVGLGDHIKRTRYADTLEIIGEKGADAFYDGPIANRTIAAIQSTGGIMTKEDLRGYRVKIREPMKFDFHGSKRVWSSGAPSSGAVVLSALKTMATYSDEENDKAGSNLTTHRLIEATKFAYGERAEYGDPDFVHNVTTLEKHALSVDNIAKKRSLITDNSTHPTEYYDPGKYTVLTDAGTSQLSALDNDGLSITLTTTVNLFWGSNIMTSDGIILNDELDDFSSPGLTNAFGYVPSSVNFIRPGKRPLSSISPVIIEDIRTGKTTHAFGSAGGSHIVTANIINGFNVLQGMDLQESLKMPRWHDQLLPATTSFEWADSSPLIPNWKGYDNSTVSFLASLGHNVSWVAPGSSTAQGAYRTNQGLFKGASENRQLAARSAAV
ncbi:hypothetical protein CBS101457_000038 [Exobasidium rhododendri]|nr:hypothetical protein CBS101457_000038 [Exobasidium rhododendri]